MNPSHSTHLPKLDRNTHRRILQFFNEVVRPQDLDALEGESHGAGHGFHRAGHTDFKLSRKTVAGIIGYRDENAPLGYRHIREILDARLIDLDILGGLIFRFGPAYYGRWDTTYETQFEDGTAYHVAHASLCKNGKVLFLPEANSKTTILWDAADLVTPNFTYMVNDPDEFLFCSGHATLSDGRLLVAGGGGGGPSNVNRAYIFDPLGPSWTRTTGDMTYARWYPTLVTLGDERRVLVVGGFPEVATAEVYDEFTGTFTLLTGPASTRSFPQLYPGLHMLPGGEVFYTRTGFGSAGAGPGGSGDPLSSTAYLTYSAPSTGAWTEVAAIQEHISRIRGMSVLLLDDCLHARILVAGGTGAPGDSTSEVIDLSGLTPIWEMPMIIPGGVSRNNLNAVLLPDGKAFVCGGTFDPTLPSAMFNPATGMWSSMDSLNYRKQYHSVAVLLPSGKVMATGGSNYGGGSNVIEIFNPPYLFNLDGSWATRPTISTSPAMVHHGAHFAIESPEAADIARIVLVRPMAVTHQTDSEQRVVPLRFTRTGTTLNITMPNGHHPHGTAPRGHYMLFILNASGVPSEGRFIFLH